MPTRNPSSSGSLQSDIGAGNNESKAEVPYIKRTSEQVKAVQTLRYDTFKALEQGKDALSDVDAKTSSGGSYPSERKQFNKEMKVLLTKDPTPVKRNDQDLKAAINGYFDRLAGGYLGTYSETGQGGNGYALDPFKVERTSKDKIEIVRHGNEINYTGDEKNYITQDKFYVRDWSPKAYLKAEKIALIMKYFVKDD